MAGVDFKIGADSSAFKQGVSEAQASLKTMDAALKVNEASFKAGGDAQVYMQQKTQLLTDKMNRQKALVTQLQQGLQQMRAQGIAPTSVEYQKLEQQMLNAQTAMLETKSSIDGLDQSQQTATKSAGTLADSVNSIGKKISLDQVIGGIDRITGGLENAARKAAGLAEQIWDAIMDSARWSDDIATQAIINGMSATEYQAMKNVAKTWGETSVEAIAQARKRVQKNVGDMSKDVQTAFEKMGISTRQWVTESGQSGPVSRMRDWEDIFWETGEALQNLGNEYERETYAQAIFGRKWDELRPMFAMGRDEYTKALDEQKTVSEKTIGEMAKLNDTVTQMQQNFNTLKTEVLGGLAPALTKGAESVSDLLGRLIDYSQTPEGQDMISKLGESVGTLFEDLGKIDPEDVVENFVAVFDRLKQGFEWIADHKSDVITALEGIAIGFGALKISEGVLTALKIIAGLKGLTIGGDVAASAASGGGGGWLGRATEAVTNRITGNIGIVSGLMNGAVVGDWFMNNTEVGQRLRNGEGMAGAIDTIRTYLTETLPKNWNDFLETSYWGEIGQMYVNGIKKWTEDHSASNSSILGEPGQLLDEWNRLIGESGKEVEIPTEPVVPENAAEAISKVIGPVTVPVVLSVRNGAGYGGSTGGGTMSLLADIGNGSVGRFGYHANGIWSVPFDGYPAILHAGERVVPAREVSSRSYNSNLYVEKMIMNSGADAQGLADAMASANRRRMSGYGS